MHWSNKKSVWRRRGFTPALGGGVVVSRDDSLPLLLSLLRVPAHTRRESPTHWQTREPAGPSTWDKGRRRASKQANGGSRGRFGSRPEARSQQRDVESPKTGAACKVLFLPTGISPALVVVGVRHWSFSAPRSLSDSSLNETFFSSSPTPWSAALKNTTTAAHKEPRTVRTAPRWTLRTQPQTKTTLSHPWKHYPPGKGETVSRAVR